MGVTPKKKKINATKQLIAKNSKNVNYNKSKKNTNHIGKLNLKKYVFNKQQKYLY